MFDAAQALLIEEGISFREHSGAHAAAGERLRMSRKLRVTCSLQTPPLRLPHKRPEPRHEAGAPGSVLWEFAA
jgi:hypothetical protein